MNEIKSLIQKIVESEVPVQSFVAKVLVVDKAKSVCDVEPINGDAVILDVRLRASADDDKGVMIYPKVGSKVVVSLIGNKDTSAFVSLFDEIESILLSVSSTFQCHVSSEGKVEIQAREIEINGGLLGGMVKIEPLLQSLNRLEGKLNQHIDTFNVHVHPASGVVTTMPSTAKIPVFSKRDDLENSKIKH